MEKKFPMNPPSPAEFPMIFHGGWRGGGMDIFWNHTIKMDDGSGWKWIRVDKSEWKWMKVDRWMNENGWRWMTLNEDWWRWILVNESETSIQWRGKGRVVTKISSYQVNITTRRGIKQLRISFGSIFLLFFNESSQGPHEKSRPPVPGPLWQPCKGLTKYVC